MYWLQCLVNKILRLSQWHLCLSVTVVHAFSTLLSPSCHGLCVCDYRNLKDANVWRASSIYSGRSLPLFPFCTPPRSSRSPCFRKLPSKSCLGLGDQFEFKIWDVCQVWDFLTCDICQLVLLPDQKKIFFQNLPTPVPVDLHLFHILKILLLNLLFVAPVKNIFIQTQRCHQEFWDIVSIQELHLAIITLLGISICTPALCPREFCAEIEYSIFLPLHQKSLQYFHNKYLFAP